MNQQIQKIYDEAVAHASSELGIWQTSWTPDSPRFNYEKCLYEKFAELIVKDCVQVVDIWSDEVPGAEGYDKFTVGKLKEHFGVEE